MRLKEKIIIINSDKFPIPTKISLIYDIDKNVALLFFGKLFLYL